MHRHNQENCCAGLYAEFKFEDLRSALLPKKRGIYVIKVRKEGNPAKEIVKPVKQIVENLKWKMVEKHILNRINRLKGINQCPTIYIGSAGYRENSKNTLNNRYKELSGRHTAMYPIWALLYFGWDLEFGWKEESNPKDAECQLKQEYKKKHGDELPALVKR